MTASLACAAESTAAATTSVDERGYNQVWASTPSTQVRSDRRAKMLAAALCVAPGGRVLEIGSGRGSKAPIVAKATRCHVTGLDLSADFTEFARRSNEADASVDFVCSSVSDLATEQTGTYDAIYGDGILHHLVYDLDRSLALFQRLLRPGGSLAFLEPNKANPYVFGIFNIEALRRATKLEPDEMAFTRTFIQTKWESCGFTNVDVSYRDFLLPGIPVFAVNPVVRVGDMIERVPGLRALSQSLLITGSVAAEPPTGRADVVHQTPSVG